MSATQTEYRNHMTASAPTSGRALDLVSLALLIVGGVNWGLVGLFNLDLVATLFGDGTVLARIVYVLVGLAALYGIVTAVRLAKRG
jgi:uncharacterized membrane protein YuzA (DUF378 family)